MLAEARRKQKWSSDPRNSTWTNDESRFGVKMMEKMGWQKGKGLGVNEDGSTNHVKVSKKNDNKGLGCSLTYEHNWVAHQDDFASLLSQLNNDNKKENSTKDKDISVSNLEMKSKSQKTLHYQKFARGKNLSLYKKEDMSAIFGKMPDPNEALEQNKISKDKQKKRKSKKTKKIPVEVDVPQEGNTINSEYNVQEYFAMRMAMISGKRTAQAVASDERESVSKEICTPVASDNECQPPKKKKSKKSKKSKNKTKLEKESASSLNVSLASAPIVNACPS